MFFTIYGHVSKPFKLFLVSPTPEGYIQNLVTFGPVFSEKKSIEIVNGRRRLPVLKAPPEPSALGRYLEIST